MITAAQGIDLADHAREVWRTAAPVGSWQWSHEHMEISREEAPTPELAGAWKGATTPHLEHWHDIASARCIGPRYIGERDPFAHMTEEIWLVTGSQTGKTRSFLYNELCYLIDQFPGPVGFVLPRRKDFKEVIDTRLWPVFKDNEYMMRLFPSSPREMKKLITYQSWMLNNGTALRYLCGEIINDMISWPMTRMLWDEFEQLPSDVGGQGNPIKLGLDRMKARPGNRLSIGVTTCAEVDGHGWNRLCSGSHERLLIRCPVCGADQELHPDQLRWPAEADPERIKIHALAWWECRWCKHRIDNRTKDRLVAEACRERRWVPGKWAITGDAPLGIWTPRATFSDKHQLLSVPTLETTIRTGHLNSLYSQFISLSAFVEDGEKSRLHGTAQEVTTHRNGWRAEPTMESSEAPITVVAIAKNAGHYARGTIPVAVKWLALVCDQQGNSMGTAWFPWVIRGFAPGGDSWLIDCGEAKDWSELKAVEDRQWPGRMINFCAMDGNNGMMTVAVQRWASGDPGRRLILLGRRHLDVPHKPFTRQSDKRRQVRLAGTQSFLFDSNAWKTTVRDRLDQATGSLPFLLPDDTPKDYTDSLTSEERVWVKERMPGQRHELIQVWERRKYRDERGNLRERTDNHYWDCEAMAAALASILGWSDPPTKPQVKRRYGIVGTVGHKAQE